MALDVKALVTELRNAESEINSAGNFVTDPRGRDTLRRAMQAVQRAIVITRSP